MNQSIAVTLKPDRFRINTAQLVIPSFFIATLSLTLPVLTLQVYDRILPNPDSGTMPVLIGGVCVAILLEIGLRLGRAYTLGWSGASYEHLLSCSAIDHALSCDLAALDKNGAGRNLNHLAAIGKLKEFHNGYTLVTYTELTFVFIYLGLMAYIAGYLVLVPVTILIAFTTTSIILGNRLKDALQARETADDNRHNFLIESLRGIHTIKSFSLEKPFQRRYERIQFDATLANYDVTEATAGTFNAATIFSHLMLICVISVGALFVLRGHMTSGALIASIFLSGRLMQPVQRALGLWTRYQDYQVAQARVRELFTGGKTEMRKAGNPDRAGRLELSEVGFGTLFRNVNLTLARGESVQITGQAGAGKTTLLKAMAGLYPPSTGTILVDGQHPLAYEPEFLMNHVGMIGTQGTIFRGRIRDNLTSFGMVQDEDVRPIISMLGLETEIGRLARGFDTWLEGSEQDTVPPGLRQRIAIARVLARRPRILLFDNADQNLSRDGYRALHSTLARIKEKTALVLITEDKNLSRLADATMMLTADGLVEVAPATTHSIRYKELRSC